MHRSLSDIGSSLTALVTPFRDGGVDWTALCRLAERQVARGTAALVICGSTGEAASLILSEYARAIRSVVEVTAHCAPVIVGCTTLVTSAAVTMGIEAASAGADALLCAVPPYVKPTQEGIIAHIRAIAHATDLPVVLYDVPSRCGDDFLQWSGDDATAPAYRAMGGTGCISVTANVAPALCALLHRSWDSGDLVRFAALRDLLDLLNAVLFKESNPIPVKAALAGLGLCTDEVRLPLTRATLATQELLLKLMPPVMLAEEHAAHEPMFALAS